VSIFKNKFVTKSVGTALGLTLLLAQSYSMAENTELKNEKPKLTFCSMDNWLCVTPLMRTNARLSSGKALTDVVASNIGATFSQPDTNLFFTVKGSLIPFIKYSSIKKEADETVEYKTEEARETLTAKLAQADLNAQNQIKATLAAAKVPVGTPTYNALYNNYYGLAKAQIAAQKKAFGLLISQKEEHALNENQRRLKELQKQDGLQEFVIGYKDQTFMFRAGKFKAGTGFQQDEPSEMSKAAGQRIVTDEAATNGFPRGNIEAAVRDIKLPNNVQLSLVAWAGKDGRLYTSATQDVSNALRMTDQEFDKDAKLIGFNAYGGKLKFDFGQSGNELTLTAISTDGKMSAGSEIRIEVTPDIIAHLAYMYAQKAAVKGNQVRAQVEKHLGEFATAEWTIAVYTEHVEGLRSYDQIPLNIDSLDGKITRTTPGIALSASKEKIAGSPVNVNSVLNFSYSFGKVDSPMQNGAPISGNVAPVDNGALIMFTTNIQL
jgi:hypothetical protein